MIEKYIYVPGEHSTGFNCTPLNLIGHEKTAEDKSSKLDNRIIEVVKNIKPDPDNSIHVLLTALGSGESWGENSNVDYFAEKELNPADHITHFGHKTFINAGIFTHHKNKDKSRSLGDVLLSIFNPIMKRVELIERVDRDKANKFNAKDIYDRLNDGEHLDVSMGCKVKYDICMICGNKAPTRLQYCKEMLENPGGILPDGRVICVYNPEPVFFDISFVNVGAAKNAKVMKKFASFQELPNNITYSFSSFTNFEKTATVISNADIGVKRKDFESYYDDVIRDILIDYALKRKKDEASSEAIRAHLRATSDPEYPVSHISKETSVKTSKKKRQIVFNDLLINIEYDKGDIRKGKTWETKMMCSYGNIPGTAADDKEAIDVYINNEPKGNKVFIIDQLKDKEHDEDKIMLGFSNGLEAKKMYLAHIPSKHFGSIKEISMEAFKENYLEKFKKEAANKNTDCSQVMKSVTSNSEDVINELFKRTKNASQSKKSEIIKNIPAEISLITEEADKKKVLNKDKLSVAKKY